MSLLRLNQSEDRTKREAYARIVPVAAWEHLASIDAELYEGGAASEDAFRAIAREDRPEAHLRIPAVRYDRDYCLSLDLEEAGAGQLELGFIVINDLSKPRFNIDVDDYGNVTLLGTAERNIGEELRALEAGLGPCQVRPGLRMFGDLLGRLEAFAKMLGYVAIQLQPLTYHNAIMYERFGFTYIVGHKRMVQIDREFRPGGALTKLLDGSPFRKPEFARTTRGRSWAIHDGILEDFDGQETLNFQMVKVIGEHAGEETFSG